MLFPNSRKNHPLLLTPPSSYSPRGKRAASISGRLHLPLGLPAPSTLGSIQFLQEEVPSHLGAFAQAASFANSFPAAPPQAVLFTQFTPTWHSGLSLTVASFRNPSWISRPRLRYSIPLLFIYFSPTHFHTQPRSLVLCPSCDDLLTSVLQAPPEGASPRLCLPLCPSGSGDGAQ